MRQEQTEADNRQNAGGEDRQRRRRLAYRARHRGIREMDLLLGACADKNIEKLSSGDLQALEHIMSYDDNELLDFFTGAIAIPADIDHRLFRDILTCRKQAA